MVTKKKSKSHPEETANAGDALEKAAKAIGSAIGTIAVKTGIVSPKKRVKLISKGKKRLPRKEKKRLQKSAAKTSAAKHSS